VKFANYLKVLNINIDLKSKNENIIDGVEPKRLE
jgi:hypothetical protein